MVFIVCFTSFITKLICRSSYLDIIQLGPIDDARKGARKGKGNIVMVGKKGNKVRLEIVQNLLSLRL